MTSKLPQLKMALGPRNTSSSITIACLEGAALFQQLYSTHGFPFFSFYYYYFYRDDSKNSVVEGAASCHQTHAFEFIVLLPLHPAVLKPDFDLSFGKTQGVGYLYPPPSGQVSIEVKLFLQLQSLVAGVRSSGPFPIWSSHIYNFIERISSGNNSTIINNTSGVAGCFWMAFWERYVGMRRCMQQHHDTKTQTHTLHFRCFYRRSYKHNSFLSQTSKPNLQPCSRHKTRTDMFTHALDRFMTHLNKVFLIVHIPWLMCSFRIQGNI